MSSIFSKAPPAPPPLPDTSALEAQMSQRRQVRMPSENDRTLMEAAQRRRKAASARQGRLSTILTDQARGIVGSNGQSLGG